MKHATLGASSAARWLACPGSPRLAATVPWQPPGPYAEEGTIAHALAEKCLVENWEKTSSFVAGPVSEEMAEAVQTYLDVVRADLAALSPLTKLVVEKKFSLSSLGRPDMFGTNDAMLLEPFGILRVYDYKHGRGVAVDAVNNPQMMYYAIGAVSDVVGVEDVELVIVQPRAIHADGPVRRHRLSVSDLMRWGRDVLLPGAKATEPEDAPLSAGKHCRFCPALAVCPEQRKKAVVVAASVFAEKPKPLPTPSAMSNADIKSVLDNAEGVEAWFEAVRAYARHGLETGRVAAADIGHKLVAGRATRKWADEVKAEKWLSGILGDGAYAPKKILSPAQAEKALTGDAKKAVSTSTTETRGTQLAPLDDKRPALATTVFTEVADPGTSETPEVAS